MRVLREGKEITLQITLIERPEPQRSELPPQGGEPPAAGAKFETTSLELLRLDDQVAGQLGFAAGQSGLLVMRAPDEAAKNGLQLYDVIEGVARTPVATPAEFDAALSALTQEGPVVLRVRRVVDGRPTTRLVLWRR
jgi:serine protease Do